MCFGGLGIVEGIQHAEAFKRRLLYAVDDGGCRQPRSLQNRRRHIDYMMKLRTDLSLRLDPLRPVHNRAVARAAEVRGDLLGPLVRGVHRVRPADGVVVVGVRSAELIDLALHELNRLDLSHAVSIAISLKLPFKEPSAEAPLSPMM